MEKKWETRPLIGEKAEVHKHHAMDPRMGVLGGRAESLVGLVIVGTAWSDR